MLGAIIGDTVGSIYEFNNIKTTDFPLFKKESIYTDDSVMTMAVAEWLLEDKEHTQSGLIETIDRYARQYPCPMGGYGGMFRKWLAMPNDQKRPYNSFGNGSAMRVAACGWMAHSRQEALLLAKLSAEVTHNHPEGIKGAQAVAASIWMLRHGALKCDVREYVEKEFGYDLSRSCDEIRPGYQFDETCQGTIPAAFAAFNESDSIDDAVKQAVSLGGDSDTVACITGALAEAFYRWYEPTTMREMRKRLPAEWWPIIQRVQIEDTNRVSAENISELTWEQIFVFGSNKDGQHYGGAARYAHDHFGAEWGVGEGITGQTYALPTMEGFESMANAVERFTRWAEDNQDKIFLVTAIGCGIAGYTPDEVAPLFLEAAALPNVYLPQSFVDELKK